MSALAPAPHQRVVMAMLSGRAERWIGEELAQSIAGISWNDFLSETDDTLKPYLHWASGRPPFDALIPQRVREALAREHRAAEVRTLRWTSELRMLLAAFEEHRVECMLVKGSALQRTIYPLPSTRPMSDVDLVVRIEQMEQAKTILEQRGFILRSSIESQTPLPGMRPDEETYFVKPVGKNVLFVEVHTRVDKADPELSISPRSLWDLRVCSAGDDGLAFATLEPTAALLHLCVHLSVQHRFVRGLLWLLDVKLFVDRYGSQIEWDRLMRDCSPAGLPHVALALTLASDWLGADIPAKARALKSIEIRESATNLVWGQMWDFVRGRRPPGSLVLILMSRDRSRVSDYLRVRWKQWTTPIPGRTDSQLALMARRVWRDLGVYGAAMREGGLSLRGMRTAHRSEQRALQLQNLLSDRGGIGPAAQA